MPSFEDPPPYRPNRATFWPESFYNLRVDELPVHDNSDQWIAETSDHHANLAVGPHTHVRFDVYGQQKWNGGNPSRYFVDSLPADVDSGPDSPARRTWVANTPSAQQAGTHLYFSDLRQQGAANFLGQYVILSVIAQGDKHCILWSEDSRELMEAILYRGDRPEAAHNVTYNLDDYEQPLASNLSTPAGANGTRNPIAPLYFTYQDLVDCGTTGDLGHMVGIVFADMHASYTWPARQTDGTLSTGMPEGSVLRLPADFDETRFSEQPLRALVRTLKRYGCFLFDRSSFMRLTAPNDPEWTNALANAWGTNVDISEFEVVDLASVATPSFTRDYPLDIPDETCRFGVITDRSYSTFESSNPLGIAREHISLWTNRAQIATTVAANTAANRATWISIPMPQWSAVTAGSHDTDIDTILTALRDSYTCVWLSPSPAPESTSNTASTGTAAQWRTALDRWVTRRDALSADNVVIVPVLSGSDWESDATHPASQWLPTSSDFPLIGVDYQATSASSGFTNEAWTGLVADLSSADKDFAISRLTRAGPLSALDAWDTAVLEATTSGSRIKAVCWDDTDTALTDGVYTSFLDALAASTCYRDGFRRGVPSGEIDSIKVRNATVTPTTGSNIHSVYRKLSGEWALMKVRRYVSGSWVTFQVRRVGFFETDTDLYTANYEENY